MSLHDKYDNDILSALRQTAKNLVEVNRSLKEINAAILKLNNSLSTDTECESNREE